MRGDEVERVTLVEIKTRDRREREGVEEKVERLCNDSGLNITTTKY